MLIRLALAAALSFSAPLALAQAQKVPAQQDYQPSVGQEGKDVVWVPTPQPVVDRMLDMAKVTAEDYVIDLGSGDGRTVITAAKRGARALGIEYNPDMVKLSQRNAKAAGVSDRASFRKADLFQTDLSQATVITMFLLPEINRKLRPTILKLKPGTRIVSNTFTMAEWEPDRTETVSADQGCNSSYCTALLWIVPAQVGGTHALGDGELVLRQSFQKVSGTLRANGRTVPVEGRVYGEQVRLKAGGKEYTGKAENGKLILQ